MSVHVALLLLFYKYHIFYITVGFVSFQNKGLESLGATGVQLGVMSLD